MWREFAYADAFDEASGDHRNPTWGCTQPQMMQGDASVFGPADMLSKQNKMPMPLSALDLLADPPNTAIGSIVRDNAKQLKFEAESTDFE